MMKKRLWMVFRVWAFFGAFAVLSQSGYAGVTVDVYGGGLAGNPNTNVWTKKGIVTPSAGLTVNIPLARLFDFQVSSLYITRKSEILGFDFTNKLIGAEMGFKFKPVSFFHLSAGGYYNHRLDNPLFVTGEDWGFYGGVAINIPLGQSVRLTVQPRYHYAGRSLSFAGGKYIVDELFGFVGLSFGKEGRY